MADSLTTIYRNYREPLTGFVVGHIGRCSDVEDVVHDTFLNAFLALRRGRKVRAPLSFLFVTARNLLIDRSRNKLLSGTICFADMDHVVERVRSAEEIASAERELEAICEAIVRLPEKMRRVLVLRKVYGLSCEEIAQQLGIAPNTAREQCRVAIIKLTEGK